MTAPSPWRGAVYGTRRRAALAKRAVLRTPDAPLLQLRSIRASYAGSRGPEVLVFGDSAMFWTAPMDADKSLVDLLREQLGPDPALEVLVGPGYNPRIITALLSGLPATGARPAVVVVPTSVLMASTTWLAHPEYGYVEQSRQVRAAVAAARLPRRLAPITADQEEAYDRLRAPSLLGLDRPVAELRLFIESVPTTRWQQVVRLRHLLDHYNGERLEPDSPGVRLVGDLARELHERGLPAVAYISPVNHEVIGPALGAAAVEHVHRNARLVEQAFLTAGGPRASVVNAVADSPASDYSDPLHLNGAGRQRLATRLAAAIRPHLENA